MVEKYTSPKSSAIRQLNDELEQGILRSVENNPLVALGLDRVGVEQMSTLFDRPLESAKFNPAGFSKERLRKLGHVGGSPVDFDKPSVVLSIGNMARRGPALTRSDMAHEYGHAGIAALANFKPHNIGGSLEEAIMRHQDIQMGGPKAAAESQKYVDDRYTDPKGAMRRSKHYHKQLSDKAAKRLYSEGKRMTNKTRASEIASKGRHGDTMLVHMNPAEVQYMHENSETGLTINPETGQPEAFLPLVGAALGSYLLPAGMTMFGSTMLASAAAAGLGSFAGSMLQGDSLKQGLMTGLMSGATAGLMQGIMGAGGTGPADALAAPGGDIAASMANPGGFVPPGSGGLDLTGVGANMTPDAAFFNQAPDLSGVGGDYLIPPPAVRPSASAFMKPSAVPKPSSAPFTDVGKMQDMMFGSPTTSGYWGTTPDASFTPSGEYLPGTPDYYAPPTPTPGPQALNNLNVPGNTTLVGGEGGDLLGTGGEDPGYIDRFKTGMENYDFSLDGANATQNALLYGAGAVGIAGGGLGGFGEKPYEIPEMEKAPWIEEQFPTERTLLRPDDPFKRARGIEQSYFDPVRRPRNTAAQGGIVRGYALGGIPQNTGGARGATGADKAQAAKTVKDIEQAELTRRLGGAGGIQALLSRFGGGQTPNLPSGLMNKLQSLGGARGYAAGGQLRPYIPVPDAYQPGIDPEHKYFGPLPAVPSVPAIQAPSPIAPTATTSINPYDGSGGDDGPTGPTGPDDVGLDEAKAVSGFANSPFGMAAALGVPGGGLAFGAANLGANAVAANALGVDVDNNAFGPNAAMDAVTDNLGTGHQGLTTADFGNLDGTNTPSISGINTRAHDPRGSPRGESDSIAEAISLAMMEAEAQEADEETEGLSPTISAPTAPPQEEQTEVSTLTDEQFDAMFGTEGNLATDDGGYGIGPSEGMDPAEGEPGGMSGDDWATGGLIGGRKLANGGPVQAQPQQNPIVMGAVAAIVGNHPEPQKAVQSFIQVYGPQKFAVLRQQVIAAKSADQRGAAGIGGMIQGPGTGTSDSIPGQIMQNGQPVEEIKVSNGEGIVTKAGMGRIGEEGLDMINHPRDAAAVGRAA